ncbi:MAG TPA: GNAT family N-acetyltransferase [Planctomycetaceae bacterium]|nr:GNAT family N-acetyltransferase [Planctomycetaceae bacterium]
MIVTARMRLVPATVALARAELTDRAEFARLLSATVPDEWPPEILADALPVFLEWIEAAPDRVGWYVWYAMMRAPREARDMLADDVGDILIASGGFKGPPQDGTVEIGYSVLPRFQRQGYATEMVRALIGWAFARSDVTRIVAETTEDNTPSVRLLHRLGFVRTEPSVEPGHIRFSLNGHTEKDFD